MDKRTRAVGASIVVLAIAFAALAGAPVWTFIIGGTALSTLALVPQFALRYRFAAVALADLLATAHLASIANSFATSFAAWSVGAILNTAVNWLTNVSY